MALLKQSSKPIAKRKPRRIYKITSTLDQYKDWKVDQDSKVKPNRQLNFDAGDSLEKGAYKLKSDRSSPEKL